MGQRDRMLNDFEDRARAMTLRAVRHDEVVGDQRVTVEELKVDELFRRLRHLLAMDDRVAVIDGYPSTTPGNGSPGGGKGGGRTIAVLDDGEVIPDLVPITSVESAALERGVDPPDPVHEMAIRALAHVRKAVHALEELDAELGAFDRLRMRSKVPDPPQCFVIKDLLGIMTWDDLWTPQRATTFPKLDRSTLPEDRRTAFDEPRKVCPYVYTHVYNHHRLPTRTEALKYLTEVVASRAKGRAS